MNYNSSPDKKGPDGPSSSEPNPDNTGTPIKGRARAKKTETGWDIQFEQGFLDEMAVMSPEDRKIFEEIIDGLKDGSIDPLTLGKNLCGYCGKETAGSNICEKCANELR